MGRKEEKYLSMTAYVEINKDSTRRATGQINKVLQTLGLKINVETKFISIPAMKSIPLYIENYETIVNF